MKIKIGNYPRHYSTYYFEEWCHNKIHGKDGILNIVDESEYNWLDKVIQKVCSGWQSVLNATVNNNRLLRRKIKVRIDPHDTYSADHTLALIIVPLLKELRLSKNGSPMVDNEDVPDRLKMSKREQKIFDEGSWNKKLKFTEKEKDFIDKKYHDRWDWVLTEMIHAFECELDEDWDKQFTSGVMDINFEETVVDGKKMNQLVHGPNHTYEIDMEARKKAYARRENGRILFAKYYNALWW